MKSVWQTRKIGDVAAVQSGAGFPDRYQGQADGEIPFYKVSDMNIAGNEREMLHENNSITEEVRRELGAFLFPEGSTIFPKIGGAIATNKKRLTTRDCCVDNNVMGVIPKPGRIESDFLFYFLLAHDLSEFANEAHLPSIKKTVVEAWPIPVPPLPEQQRIVGLLDEAFAGLATAKANAQKNLQNTRALFESHLQSVFGQRGDGWVENRKPLADLCELIVDCEHRTAPTQDAGVPSIRTPNVGKGTLLLEGVNLVSEETYRVWTRRAEPRGGDLVLAREAQAGNVAVIPDNMRVCLGQRTVLIRPRTDVFEPSFLAFLLLQPTMQSKLLAYSRGATVQHVNMKDIRAFDVGPIPPLATQRTLTSSIIGIREDGERLASIYECKLAALDALKKSLLDQAFGGDL